MNPRDVCGSQLKVVINSSRATGAPQQCQRFFTASTVACRPLRGLSRALPPACLLGSSQCEPPPERYHSHHSDLVRLQVLVLRLLREEEYWQRS